MLTTYPSHAPRAFHLLVKPTGAGLPRPSLLGEHAPTRTVRVELASGTHKVAATIDERDEARLLRVLSAARTRTL